MNKELRLLQKELNTIYPELLQLQRNALVAQPEPFSSIYNLLFKNEERSCIISLYGYEKSYKCIFKWDDCSIFEVFCVDSKRLGAIVLSWVLKRFMPSKMKSLFPEIEFGLLAEYYEKGERIKGEFIVSWNSIEKFYGSFSDSWSSNGEDALRLIKEMRNAGLDEKLRAGQSLWFFILSRSRRHGLEENTQYIQITFLGSNRMSIKSYFDGKETIEEKEVKYEGYLKDNIKELLKESIK